MVKGVEIAEVIFRDNRGGQIVLIAQLHQGRGQVGAIQRQRVCQKFVNNQFVLFKGFYPQLHTDIIPQKQKNTSKRKIKDLQFC